MPFANTLGWKTCDAIPALYKIICTRVTIHADGNIGQNGLEAAIRRA